MEDNWAMLEELVTRVLGGVRVTREERAGKDEPRLKPLPEWPQPQGEETAAEGEGGGHARPPRP